MNADSSLYHSMLGYNMFAYCNNNPVNFYDPTGDFAISIGALAGALVVLIKAAVAAAAATVAIGAAVEIGKTIGNAVADAQEAADEPKQSITEPEDVASNDEANYEKDSRLKGEPGEIKKDGNKETYIGSDGRASKERHWTNHGHPKQHSNPHDHDVSWDSNGNPDFGPPQNYWNGNVPIFP